MQVLTFSPFSSSQRYLLETSSGIELFSVRTELIEANLVYLKSISD